MIDQKEIEIKALRVLDENDIKTPVVDVAKIAKGQGVEIREINMPKEYENVAGFYDKKSKIIYIEKNDPPQRKLFSVAHELGHIFLKHENATVLFRITRADTKYPAEESQANAFAAHLLMPDFMIHEYMEKYNLSRSDYKRLASMFGVPLSAMKYTLTYLK